MVIFHSYVSLPEGRWAMDLGKHTWMGHGVRENELVAMAYKCLFHWDFFGVNKPQLLTS